MTTPTVAKRKLQDATHCPAGDRYCDYAIGLRPSGRVVDRYGDLIQYVYHPGIEPGEACWNVAMSAVTIDGHRRKCYDSYGTYMFNVKEDTDTYCNPDEQDYCRCRPREYIPESYAYGDICEPCWIQRGLVVTVGYMPCNHRGAGK